jgi:hypothetical protein
MAYSVEVSFSGTGALRSVFLLDMRNRPRLIDVAHGGRLRESDFPTTEEYLKAAAGMRAALKRAGGE